jgi:putative tricarboxylic transport membrane protein
MRTQRSADLTSGILMAGLGLITVLAARRIDGIPLENLHPRTMPLALGWIVLACGVALSVNALSFRGANLPLEWPERPGAVRVLATLASLAAYLLLIGPLGLSLPTFFFVSFLVWFIGKYSVVRSVAIGAASATATFIIFVRLLELPVPPGLLGW